MILVSPTLLVLLCRRGARTIPLMRRYRSGDEASCLS